MSPAARLGVGSVADPNGTRWRMVRWRVPRALTAGPVVSVEMAQDPGIGSRGDPPQPRCLSRPIAGSGQKGGHLQRKVKHP